MKFALIGYGNVARGLLDILREKQGEHSFECAGVLRRSGARVGPPGEAEPDCHLQITAAEFLDRCGAEVLVELSSLNPQTGEPATQHIREALGRGMHAVTANKGPVAHAYCELAEMAQSRGVRFLHEAAVMDGAPVFNLFRHNLPGVQVLGFTGVLNSTTKLIIEAMERGASFEDGVEIAQKLGIAETNYEHDTQGWDSAVKTAALANVLMDARITPAAVEREGIHGFSGEGIRELATGGRTVRLVSRGMREDGRLKLSVRPEILEKSDLLASVAGTSNLILFHTDFMGTIGTVSIAPTVRQTAYGVYIDLLELTKGTSSIS